MKKRCNPSGFSVKRRRVADLHSHEVRTIRWREVIPRLFPFLNRVLGMRE
jgi:hypothetical protein